MDRTDSRETPRCKWTKETVTMGAQRFPANESFPALIYPNPLNPAKYVVINTGLTIEDRGYNGDYGTPLWGDYAIVKVKPDAAVPDLLDTAGLLNDDEIVAEAFAEITRQIPRHYLG